VRSAHPDADLLCPVLCGLGPAAVIGLKRSYCTAQRGRWPLPDGVNALDPNVADQVDEDGKPQATTAASQWVCKLQFLIQGYGTTIAIGTKNPLAVNAFLCPRYLH